LFLAGGFAAGLSIPSQDRCQLADKQDFTLERLNNSLQIKVKSTLNFATWRRPDSLRKAPGEREPGEKVTGWQLFGGTWKPQSLWHPKFAKCDCFIILKHFNPIILCLPPNAVNPLSSNAITSANARCLAVERN
jgi:hypothetical protein